MSSELTAWALMYKNACYSVSFLPCIFSYEDYVCTFVWECLVSVTQRTWHRSRLMCVVGEDILVPVSVCSQIVYKMSTLTLWLESFDPWLWLISSLNSTPIILELDLNISSFPILQWIHVLYYLWEFFSMSLTFEFRKKVFVQPTYNKYTWNSFSLVNNLWYFSYFILPGLWI